MASPPALDPHAPEPNETWILKQVQDDDGILGEVIAKIPQRFVTRASGSRNAA
jgi:hypothetical protein